MRRIIIVAIAAMTLAGCQTARDDRVAGGALLGGATGAAIGGIAGRSVGGAVAGGIIGAAAGAIIADSTRPGRCYTHNRYGERVWVRCP